MKTTLITTFAIAVMVFAFNTNPAMAAGAWGVFGFNKSVDEVEDPNETEVAQYEPDYEWKWEQDPNTGNYGWMKKYMNEGETSSDNVAWQPSIQTRPKGNNDSTQERIRVFGNTENDDRELAWTEDDQDFRDRDRKDMVKSIFAGLTAKEKQQQDEDDWNAWIWQQFAGLRPGQREALENDAEQMANWAKQQFASWMDDEKKDQYGDDWFNNQDANTEQREFARESSFGDRSQSAGDGIDASLVGDIESDIIEREDTENDRVLESGDY